ncbi:LacI family DNA-binding transcriptional regulator [Enterococcus sp. LJL99]
MVGIREVARKANVSPATVSRVLNHDKTISVAETTKERIFAVAANLNYDINQRKYVKKRLPSIGIISTISQKAAAEGYYKELQIGLEEEARRLHLGMNRIYHLPDSPKKWTDLDQLGAIIIIGTVTKSAINSILAQNKQLIIVDNPEIQQNVDMVYGDLERMTRSVLELFLENGHQNIAYIGGKKADFNEEGQPTIATHEKRTQTYLRFMEENKLERFIDCRLGAWDEASGERLTRQLLETSDNRPTALLLGNDLMAAGAYNAIQEKKLTIGKDIVLVSFDNLELTEKLTPKLTSVQINAKSIGKTAVRLALERIDAIREEAIIVTYPTQLIVRESFIPIK